MFMFSLSKTKYSMSSPCTSPAVPENSFFPAEMWPPFGMDSAIIVSPGSESVEYTARLAQAPETGRTSANSALNNILARLMASSSIWSMNLQPAYTLSPGQPSAYLCPKSEERTCLTVREATFSLATSGRLSENHFSCCFTSEMILPY